MARRRERGAPGVALPDCGREVRWYENVPVVSWLALAAGAAGAGSPSRRSTRPSSWSTGLTWAAAAAGFGATLDGLRVAVFATVLLGIA
jgi:leader peptidase (prepilin peptidase)/N-methyltransferase